MDFAEELDADMIDAGGVLAIVAMGLNWKAVAGVVLGPCEAVVGGGMPICSELILSSSLSSSRSRMLSVCHSLKVFGLLKASAVGWTGLLSAASVRCSGAEGPGRGVIKSPSESQSVADWD